MLLSSHLLLAVKDETCSHSVLGEEARPIMKLLLKLIDQPNLQQNNFDLIESTLKVGAQFLLPEPQARVELLLSLLPQTSDDLKSATIGQVSNLLLSC